MRESGQLFTTDNNFADYSPIQRQKSIIYILECNNIKPNRLTVQNFFLSPLALSIINIKYNFIQ